MNNATRKIKKYLKVHDISQRARAHNIDDFRDELNISIEEIFIAIGKLLKKDKIYIMNFSPTGYAIWLRNKKKERKRYLMTKYKFITQLKHCPHCKAIFEEDDKAFWYETGLCQYCHKEIEIKGDN